MGFLNGSELPNAMIEFFAVLFSICGFMTFAAGTYLILRREEALRHFENINCSISARFFSKSKVIQRNVRGAEKKHIRLIALFFIIGGIYALDGLITGFVTYELMSAFRISGVLSALMFWMIEGVRWSLISGNLFAIGIGLMLILFPRMSGFLQYSGGVFPTIWRSVNSVVRKPFTLDSWAAEFPRLAGWIICVAGLVPMGDFGTMLYGIR